MVRGGGKKIPWAERRKAKGRGGGGVCFVLLVFVFLFSVSLSPIFFLPRRSGPVASDEALRASALLELAHVSGVNRRPVDVDSRHVRHVAAPLVVLHKDGDAPHVLKLREIQLNLFTARNLRRGEGQRLGSFFTAVVETEVGLVDEDLHNLGSRTYVTGYPRKEKKHNHPTYNVILLSQTTRVIVMIISVCTFTGHRQRNHFPQNLRR